MSAQSFLIKAINNNGKPIFINIDNIGSNSVAIRVYNKRALANKLIIKNKYLNNIVEQDHRFIKWRIRQGLGFKYFESARRTLPRIMINHLLTFYVNSLGTHLTMNLSFFIRVII